ncbi:DEAD/DEAH box helicase [Kocuria sp. UBA5001]|uniref:DEAD/DEAH box helicase n=1 Tax=Kocuria sp. UBA5001 TaxID=1946674 RepID=UPI0025BF796B|nr:AAA domain-containing protein [Kocuria sp. UBA5001]
MVETATITDYLARILRRGQLDEVSFGDGPYVAVPRSLLRAGFLPEEQTRTLFDAHDDATGRRGRATSSSEETAEVTATPTAQVRGGGAARTRAADAEEGGTRTGADAAAPAGEHRGDNGTGPFDGEPSDGATRDEGGSDEQDRTPLSVVVSCVSLELPGGGHTGLLLLEATLFPDGRLEPVLETASSPWIPSERLSSPMVGDREVMVGDLEAFWAFSRQQLGAGVSQTTSLAGALDLADSLFAALAGRSVAEFAAVLSGDGQHSESATPPAHCDTSGNGRVEHELCFVRELERVNAVGPLLDLYDHVADHGAPVLLERMCQGWSGARIAERAIHEGEGLHEAMKLSCGSMSDGFPLTPSQRRAVHAFLSGEEGDVTAVSGPPGTGKTTMLQAVVANMLTRHALEDRDAPVIVGTSTNNQAVTNIISSFSSVTRNDPGTLDLRWLPSAEGMGSTELRTSEEIQEARKTPEIQETEKAQEPATTGQSEGSGAFEATPLRSLAVYCPASSRLREARTKYLLEQRNKSETYTVYSDPRYLGRARDTFVARASAHVGSAHDLPGIKGWITDALAELEELRLVLVEEMARHGATDRYARLCAEAVSSPHLMSLEKVAGLAACTTLEELDAVLDVTLRYAEFWLAVHHYEACWLLTEDFIPEDERFKNTATVMSTYWPQAAALTPCFVMTAYQVPRYFGLYSRSGEPARFDVGRIDLLIVDEAGQVDTPVGLPAFALARRALVVGDEKQLAPVWSIDEDTDREVAESAGIPAETWAQNLRPRGMTCSPHSSLMRAASHASAWSYHDGAPGIFLSEHFRCHPEIIGYCNDLLYNGLLEPKRPASSSPVEGPAFLFREVPGSQDERSGSSRVNRTEAQCVARWIVANYAYFRDLYTTREPDSNRAPGEDELIGVVTPFSAQARLITRELRAAATAEDAPADLPSRFAESITVGTAHRLQGAERPVVLFSAVYGQNSPRSGFIDSNLELMNVAVSRAKDLFIVFAAANRWGNGPVFERMTEWAHRSDAVFAATVPEPEPAGNSVPEAASSSAEPLTLTAVVKEWKARGVLSEEDAAITTTAWNLRLAEAGVLVGGTGAWEPTALAERLGVVTEQRHNAKGDEYTAIAYTPRMQALLQQLYRDGRL